MTNPKETRARDGNKPQTQYIPPGYLPDLAAVFQHGGEKYGRFNWRASGIKESTYWAAIDRHFDAWKGGESIDPDSGKNHLYHIIASCMILLDAERCHKLEKDRDLTEVFEEDS